jgi:electron transport complex protein RnfC
VQTEITLLEQINSSKIWDFPGGVHPPQRKSLSNQSKIGFFPLPHTFYVPLVQHIGQSGDILVSAGDKVLKGQVLTQCSTGLNLPVHAPTSGTVREITEHVSAHPSGKPTLTVVIDADGNDDAIDNTPLSNWKECEPEKLVQHIKDMGIAGLGGATFPTYAKHNTNNNIDVLIINAVECEPYITADDVLMREYGEQIIEGIQILASLHGVGKTVIAIEDNKPEAIESIQQAASGFEDILVRVVPTKYPSGGEKQLIQVLTGKQVPTGGLPSDLGIVMHNIGTAYSVYQAVILGCPLIERVVTVTGESIIQPQNLWVRLGTPVKDVITFTGINAEKNQRLIMGGPMMGFTIMDAQMPVVKATNCLLAPREYQLPTRQTEQNCIRCSLCADACPAELLPQQLLWYSKAQDHDKLNEYHLNDCIECGACAYVCPSQIPLVQYYRTSKAEIRTAEQERLKSDKAKQRFEARQARLEQEKQARLQKHKEAAERRRQAMDQDSSAKDKVAAALERAKAKKAQQSQVVESTDESPKDKVAAAIARAKAKKQQTTDNESTEANDSTKNKVQEAIARAKAKKAEAESSANEVDAEKTPEQIKKERVAAAIAKAKKSKEKAEASETAHPASDESEEKTPEQIKKDKVAAAIAKAKAKKAKENTEASETAPPASDESEEKTPEQIKKEKVAAAIAKAKAKKAKENAEASETAHPASDESEEKTPEQIKKEKVAAAIAKAKAKKLAESNKEEN